MASRVKAGKAFTSLEDDDAPVAPAPVVAGRDFIAALSAKGRLLLFSFDEMKEMPRGRGVLVMGLDKGEKLIAVGLTVRNKVTVYGANRVGNEVVAELGGNELTKYRLSRGRKGCLIPHKLKPLRLA